MKYELIHNTVARLIFEKASTEARTRRKVEKYVRERLEAYEQRGAKLTQDDIDFISPYLDLLDSAGAVWPVGELPLYLARVKSPKLTAKIL